MSTLEHRTAAFLSRRPDGEAIDGLALTSAQRRAKRADYFLDNRRVVCELKSIQTDTGEKIEEILEPHRSRPEWPLFYGTWSSEKVLARLPDGEAIREQIFLAVTSSIENLVARANRQVRETKRGFDLPDAHGMLVVVNDLVEILSPTVIASRISKLMSKRTSSGARRFESLDVVWILSETHDIVLGPRWRGTPSVFLSPHETDHPAVSYVSYLHARWAASYGLPVTQGPERSVRDFEGRLRARSDERVPDRLPRQEWWEREYRARPYLRRLSEDQLFEHGAKVMGQMAGFMLKGARPTSAGERKRRTERWTHFLEEIKHRAIDLRVWGPKVRDISFSRGYLKRPVRDSDNPASP